MASEKYSDLTIECDGRKFKVHRVVMCSASPVIAGACDNNMKEREEGVIEHNEYDADTVERMIQYVYTQTYDVDKAGPSGAAEDMVKPAFHDTTSADINDVLIAHARVFVIGDYYDLPGLKVLAVERFAEAATAVWKLEGFIDVIKEIAVEHITELMQSDEFAGNLATMEGVQNFTVDLLRSLVHHHIGEVKVLKGGLQDALDLLDSGMENFKTLRVALTAEKARANGSEQRLQSYAQQLALLMQRHAHGLRQ
ncbi:hypothetical protein LTR97_003851 [Elasticomyces elasticus]|uniref:BTB domain-containing protein n=1 Tax=Elasticomyces elasticus TaxID=574655 RepID=A0AAN8A3W4_9PEZI|nr:hypothetical protein LTR97_003851 [Elasticomyces elasticus]